MVINKGKVRFSFDFECGWGLAQGEGWRKAESQGVFKELRPAMYRLVQRLDELELSFTWAVVGGMVDEPSQRDVSYLKGSFANDMQVFLSEAEEKTVDGRDLLDLLVGMRTKQKFGTHTYSHLLFTDQDQDCKVIAKDLSMAKSVNLRLGLDATRLVFPRNQAGYFRVLQSLGITNVRMPAANALHPHQLSGALGRGISLAFRPISEVSEIKDESGLIFHYASELLNWGHSAGVLKKYLVRRRRKHAMHAAKNGSDIHFWIHPFDIVQTKGLENDVFTLISDVASLRDQGLIDVDGF